MIGALIIDKPEGITSHDVVARVRRASGIRRVGHAGTLDPFATGVLVVCLGRATRLLQFLTGAEKEYLATVRLGYSTDTQDLTGKPITPVMQTDHLGKAEIGNALATFIGPQLQLPPMYSAKKVDGEKLYVAARAGREVERQPASITVLTLEMVSEPDGPVRNIDGTCDFQMRVKCSAGTYVRTLAHDLGGRLEVGAHLAALRRLAVGEFRIERSVTLDGLDGPRHGDGSFPSLISPREMLARFPEVVLDAAQVDRVVHGREVRVTQALADRQPVESGLVRLSDSSGDLIAVGECDLEARSIRPRVVLSAGD